MPDELNPIRPTTPEALDMTRALLMKARHAALAVLHPKTGAPYASRIGCMVSDNFQPLSLMSELATHTRALQKNPNCSLLVGEPEERGDPLTNPRLTLVAKAHFIMREASNYEAIRSQYLAVIPKAKLYVDFGDFSFVSFEINRIDLNGGFGKAFRIDPMELQD